MRLVFRSADTPLDRVITGFQALREISGIGRIEKLLCAGPAREIADASDL